MADIVVVGSINIDLIFRMPRMPEAGETLLGLGFSTAPGGKGSNQAVAAARLGGQVAMVGCVGNDDFGRVMTGSLEAACVDIKDVQVLDSTPTGVAAILLDQKGENRIIVTQGANHQLTPQVVDRAAELIGSARMLVAQLEIPLESVMQAAALAHQVGVKVLLNTAPAHRLPEGLLELVDVLVCNLGEARLLTGSAEDSSPGEILERLYRLCPRMVVMTLGGQGSLAKTPAGQIQAPAYPVEVKDTTGAGDAFVGGLAVALLEGKTPEQALRWGNAAGAIACQRLGAQPSLPRRDEVLNLLGIEQDEKRDIADCAPASRHR